VGLALQGSLSNLAGGVLILILKPFVVGDYILENGTKCEGTVQSIEIFYTRLLTPDHKIVVIPNGSLSATSVTNFTAQTTRRVEISVGISYGSDIKLAKETLQKLAEASPFLVTDTELPIQVYVDSFGDSAVNMGLRFFVPTEHYWDAKWAATEQIKTAFAEAGIEIPFNQMEVTMK
jgi:small conductance mechanosensitive channel